MRGELRSLLAELDVTASVRSGRRHDVVLAREVVRTASDRLRTLRPGSHVSTSPLSARDVLHLDIVLGPRGVDLAASPDRQHEWVTAAGALLADSLLRGNVHLLAQVAIRARNARAHQAPATHTPAPVHEPAALLDILAWTAAEASSAARKRRT